MLSLKTTSWPLRGAAVAIAIALVAWGVLHFRSRESAVSSGEQKQLEKAAPALRDSLVAAEHRTIVITDTIHRRLTVYDSIRKTIRFTDTTRFVLVDTQFIHVADSVAKSCSELTISCSQQRAAAQEVITNQVGQIKALNVQLSHQPGKLQRIMDVAAGIAGGYGACKLTN
jgi:hypothetical protein